MISNDPVFLIVDLFCGAGGTTTGFVQAEIDGRKLAKVIACVNHDPLAIKSHWANHSEVKHFEEDIRTLDLTELISVVNFQRSLYPNAYLILWASLECTNFSKAKGGQPRDADSRTLADHLERYVKAINPDYVQIENVVEFMSWGPLDEKGKPVSRKSGTDWMRWRSEMCELGYVDQWRELNSANYGAFTSRNRLFGVFAKPDLPINFPLATHAKKPSREGMHGDLQKWKAVKEVLDFKDEGESIFTRKKPLSDKTLERIYAGLLKYVAKGDTAFISKYFSGRPKGKVNSVDDPGSTVTAFGGSSLVQTKSFSDLSVDQPAGAITTIDHHALVQTAFITQRNSGDPDSKIVDIEGPARTITATGGNQDLVQAEFLLKYNSTDNNGKHYPPSINDPAPVLTTQDRLGLVQPQFLAAYYGNGYNISSVDNPCPTVPTKDRFGLVQPLSFIMPTNFNNLPKSIDEPAPTITADRHHTYIVNPSHGGHSTSTDAPCPVIIARQDKAPLYLVQVENGPVAIAVFEGDTEPMIRIKQFMAAFNLVDIKMRMLRVNELLNIQGFPQGYKLEGNQSDQKKFIGNSVVPQVVKAWTEAMAIRLIDKIKQKRA
jgi:DNA (cytosine-5)-methyltransferase 1